ncbi:MAG TPA: alpha/beta hydrolase [Microscillaceae bacterium]|jgi:pimeloyl-ACP methyl ester carboxylesterase|nr:alpha/beta hydrolase [Microscillaceae bacterium]
MDWISVYGVVMVLMLWGLGNLLTQPWQHLFIFMPEKLPANHRFAFRHPFEEFLFDTPHEGKISALWFRKSDDNLSPKGVILYCHGNAGSLERWGYMAEVFVPMGYDLLIWDFRGYGKSQGKQSEAHFYSDVVFLYQFLLLYYEASQITVFGRSMGSGAATYLAAHHLVGKLVLETPFSSIPDLFYTYYPFLPKVFGFRFRFDNAALMSQITCPVYIFHGNKDFIVPLSCAVKLKYLLKREDRFFTIIGGGHNNLYEFATYREELQQVLP